MQNGGVRGCQVEAPLCQSGCVLIRTRRTLVAGTFDRTLAEGSAAALAARGGASAAQIDQALQAASAGGVMPTLETLYRHMNVPLPLGFSGVGVVLAVGRGVRSVAPGQRVAGLFPHAEIAQAPQRLCQVVPETVSDAAAAFAIPAAIALHAVRLAQCTLGESAVVLGLDLIGLLTAQLLAAGGCNVLAADSDADRLALAARVGATSLSLDDPESLRRIAAALPGGGADAVIVNLDAEHAAAATAGALCRRGGRVVLTGLGSVVGEEALVKGKELTVTAAGTQGPGRFDADYELGRRDYPLGFIRWSAQRDIQAVLEAMAGGRLNAEALIERRIALSDVADHYPELTRLAGAVLVEYPGSGEARSAGPVQRQRSSSAVEPSVAVIGAGRHAGEVLLPALARTQAQIAHVADLELDAARALARRFNAGRAVTDVSTIMRDANVNAVLIATGHNAHADLVIQSLENRKHVLVERPLATNLADLQAVLHSADRHSDRQLLVGFNLRFSRHVAQIQRLLIGRGEPLTMNMTVNAGYVPPEHWLHDPVRGGGRVIGQAVSYIDLLALLAGAPIKTVAATRASRGLVREDRTAICLGFEDGSTAVLNFFANGSADWLGDELEIFSDERVLRLRDFKELEGFGFPSFKRLRTTSSDRGHLRQVAAFVNRLGSGGEALIPLDQIVNSTLASFAAVTSAAENRTIILDREYRDALTVWACGKPRD
ncbi:MAG: bi-domain-containing oxidoreductase [Planctomycetaceae bacterium]|nr:bi-domain-containing oxidoreductase [Planctomycetaceae bacterium]